MVELDKPIRDLRYELKAFVKRAKRICGPDTYYEPPGDQSHLWSELCSSVEHAEDTLEMFEEGEP